MAKALRIIKIEHGIVLRELPRKNRWQVDGRSTKRPFSRKVIKARDEFEARDIALDLFKSESETTPISVKKLTVIDALCDSRMNVSARWSDTQKVHDHNSCKYFCDWCAENNLHYWSDLTHNDMQKYLKSLTDRGCSYNTIRLYFQPIKRAASYAVLMSPTIYHDICKGLQIRKPKEERKTVPFLSLHEVLDFIDFVLRRTDDEYRYSIAAAVALQGLCGLRLQEAFDFALDKYDRSNGTITIGTKNAYSLRTIPICSVARHLIELPEFRYGTRDQLGAGIRKRLRAWRPEIVFPPKDFRNTIVTTAFHEGWQGHFLERYIGHAGEEKKSQEISQRHYVSNESTFLMQGFVEKIIPHIEKQIKSWNAPADTAVLPGLRVIRKEIS